MTLTNIISNLLMLITLPSISLAVGEQGHECHADGMGHGPAWGMGMCVEMMK